MADSSCPSQVVPFLVGGLVGAVGVFAVMASKKPRSSLGLTPARPRRLARASFERDEPRRPPPRRRPRRRKLSGGCTACAAARGR